ncbi:LuxR C-terminal-related transcriptional regulator [Microbacterium sp.]|uniref:LuxR C-terminal-related transcriptional regulator n=1 Tax=Microbacterium sp. TaxID=51671 RepID=UPI0037CC1564
MERRRRTIPPHAVDRPELRAQLDAGMDSPLSLVIAPAGAGKSVLLSQWAQAAGEDRPVALLEISESDRDASVFARRLVEAVGEAAAGFRAPAAPVETGGNRLGGAFLEDLAAGLADTGPLIVIFDDVHWLSGSSVLDDLWRLVDLLPPGAHFVFSSRMDLQLGWSRHRLQHSLVEIRQRELAFDAATTARVLGAITGSAVDERIATAVTAHTEGWAAGVQLTALSLRFSRDPERIVSVLGSDERLVVDYLSEQVLGALEPDRRAALMKIAVVDEFCAPLLDAILGGAGAEAIAELERESMFVLPVSERPGWYRFHRLFRDILLLRLRAHDSQAEPHALVSAAQWCEAEGFEEKAIAYRLRARDWDGAIDGVLRLGRDLYGDTRMAAVVGWLDQVPAGVRSKRPAVDLLLAIAQGMSGQAQIAVDELRGILSERDLSAGERQAGTAYLSAFVQFVPHAEDFADAARRALVMLRDEPHVELPDLVGLTTRPLLIAVAQVSLGRALMLLGDLDSARRILRDALKGEGMAYRPYRVHALGSLALVEALSGRLVVAAGLADDALVLTEESGLRAHPAPADAYLARAVAAIRRGEPDAGSLALSEGVARAAANNRTQLLWLAHLASQIIDPDAVGAETPDAGPPPPFVRDALVALAMRHARLRGAPQHPPVSTRSWSLIAFEEVAGLLALGQPTAARARLAQLDEGTGDAPTTAVECELLRGWTAALDGRGQQSRTHLQAALAMAGPHRLVSPFVQAGPDVAELIDQLPGAADDFRRLVVLRGRALGAIRRQTLVDKLTPRELELLAYLPSRLTFADIAAHSFVSINTVKTHVGHIYRKLGVTGRDAAIERAAELGLIDPNEIARVG